MSFKLAMVQMLVEGGNKRRNLQHARDLIALAATQGAQVVLLPEAMPLGWTHSSARDDADAIPGGETCRVLADLPKTHEVYIFSGALERSGGQIFNAAVLIGPNGHVLLHH